MVTGSDRAIILFDGTFDGFLCVVYAHYYDKITPVLIQRTDHAQLTLHEKLHTITTDIAKATRVLNGIRKKISQEAADRVFYAFLSEAIATDEEKYMTLLAYIKLGFKLGHMVDSHLQDDCVRMVHNFARHVGREAHLLHGFCRFAETESGVFYCQVTPKNDVLALLADHFCQRLATQPWIIHDKVRGLAAVFDGKSYVITDVPRDASVVYAPGEKETQELWVVFFENLAIEARKNPKLQRQLLPLYFRKNMTEFMDKL